MGVPGLRCLKGGVLRPMPQGLQRYDRQGHLHCITFHCFRRRPLLGTVGAPSLVLKTLGEVRALCPFALVGNVVMPEHVHLLIKEPLKATLSTVLQVLKQRVSLCDAGANGGRGEKDPTLQTAKSGAPHTRRGRTRKDENTNARGDQSAPAWRTRPVSQTRDELGNRIAVFGQDRDFQPACQGNATRRN